PSKASSWTGGTGRRHKHAEEQRGPGRPTTRPIKRRRGWEELIRAAAGAGARSPKLETRRQRRLELLLTLRKTRGELRLWPTAGEWEASTSEHSPGAATCAPSAAGAGPA